VRARGENTAMVSIRYRGRRARAGSESDQARSQRWRRPESGGGRQGAGRAHRRGLMPRSVGLAWSGAWTRKGAVLGRLVRVLAFAPAALGAEDAELDGERESLDLVLERFFAAKGGVRRGCRGESGGKFTSARCGACGSRYRARACAGRTGSRPRPHRRCTPPRTTAGASPRRTRAACGARRGP
jgi:hypothetical protein